MKGHLRRRGDSWELRAYAGRDRDSDRKVYRTRSFRGSREDAEAELQRFLNEVSPFGELLDRWLDEHPEASPETRRAAAAHLSALRPLPPSEVAVLVDLIGKVLEQQ